MRATRRGFGLVELAVVGMIMTVVLYVLYQASYVGAVSSKKGISRLDEISKVNRLFEQLKRVLRTSRVVLEDIPKPGELQYKIVFVDEIVEASRSQRNVRAKLTRRPGAEQGVEIEFARENERPIVYPFVSADIRIYGARQLLMVQLNSENNERHNVTVSSPYFDPNSSNLAPPEMVVADLLGAGLGSTSAADPGGSPAPPDAPAAPTPAGPSTAGPIGPMATANTTVRTNASPGNTTDFGTASSNQTLAGGRTPAAGAAGPKTGLTGTRASPSPTSATTAAGTASATGLSGTLGPMTQTAMTGGRTTTLSGTGPASTTAASTTGGRSSTLSGTVGPASTTAAGTTQTQGFRPPAEADPMTWSGSGGAITPGSDSATAAGTSQTGATATGTSAAGTRTGSSATPQGGTATTAATGSSSSAGTPTAAASPGGLSADARINQLLNNRPPRGNQAEVLPGSAVNNPFE